MKGYTNWSKPMKLKIEGVELNVGPEYEISMIRIDHIQGYATVFVLYEDGEEDVFSNIPSNNKYPWSETFVGDSLQRLLNEYCCG